MPAVNSDVARARELFARGAWLECLSVLADAEAVEPLDPEAVELMGTTAYLVGREDECLAICERAYARFSAAKQYQPAARAAMWLAFTLQNRGEHARGGAWAARSQRLVDSHHLGGSEEGHLLALQAHVLLVRGHREEGVALAGRAVELGLMVPDPDVVALARLTLAWAALKAGERAEAMGIFDEIMLSVSANEASAIVAGMAYCAVIDACMQLRDLPRATEWTETLTAWCAARPDLVPYRGTCLVHRAQVLTLQGHWPAAVDQATAACALLPEREAGSAWYQLGEVHRLRGQYDLAEVAFRQANAAGRQPEPGLARLRLAQGRTDAATAALRRTSAEARMPEDRAELLAALSEALLAVGDVEGARAAAEELAEIAGELDARVLSAWAAESLGLVALAEEQPAAALPALRRAWRLWRDVDLPHQAAKVRVAIARCLRDLGDDDSARRELDAARDVFQRLGADPDVALVDTLMPGTGMASGGLTGRELEVIRLVASGRTNRAIAHELVLSEKTVARHLSNIFAKLDVTSRSAATAYAYDHGLV